MPVTFDAKPLEMFGNANFKNEDAIIHLGKDNSLTSDSTYSSANIFRWMRGSETRRNNNEIRTQLLKSLGESFGISGMSTNAKGEISFSKDFMDKLENLLGPAFKRGDFGVPAQGGAVSSGKPLTSRRLSAICESAKIYDTSNLDLGAYKQKVGVILQEQFGIKTTLNLTNEQLYKLTEKNPALEVFAGIEKSIDFLQKDFKDFFIEKPEYNVAKELNEKNLEKYTVRFQIKNLETGTYEDMRPISIMEDPAEQRKHSPSSAIFAALRGNLLHTERADFNSSKSKDLDPLNKYVEDNLKSFIKNGIDAYFEAKMNGKVGELMKHLKKSPGACTEEKSMRLYEFRQKNFQGTIDTKLEVELNSAIRKSESLPLDKVISAEFGDIDVQHPEIQTWEEYATELKKRLVGLQRPMVTMTERNGKIQFDVQKDSKGNTVTRAITPNDIENIGKKLYSMIYEGM